ncbi:hypothetical protein Arad_0760 [Rhizobium rhizogenes K84]|uniref:Uncharacterized protein n=1 Tax=Rhizobium rhizogenes (strain K84 / ATCC BAA-868) TaxID=311403 RepID=B9J8J1_RHIR8|nr:hypothetical protein Arad_0760 [Rhizobium rhizogenes K84]
MRRGFCSRQFILGRRIHHAVVAKAVSIIAKAIPSSAMMDLSAPVRGRVRHIPVVSMVPQVLRIQIPWK